MVGYFLAAKKPLERRWASRAALWVSILAASTSASTQELARFCSSIERRPCSVLKRPRVVLIDMTRIENDTYEWGGSISQIMIILLLKLLREKAAFLMYTTACEERGLRGHFCDRRAKLSQNRPLNPLSL